MNVNKATYHSWGGTRGSRKGGLVGWETVVPCGDWVAVGGTGLVGSEGEFRWKESHRQEWAGLDWKSRSDKEKENLLTD